MTTESTADFTLLFKADGAVELLDRDNETVWSSDNDDEFTEEFDGVTVFSDEDDSDDILDYLSDLELIDLAKDEIDIVENDLSDEAASDDEFRNVIEGEFTEVQRNDRRRKH